ncbi:MAG: 50S ribosomal protein L7/L12 [Oscillospiraceae bacterium]|jgi:large subunit ribosomal protein L7/L12|nr:50S ribosomal protein L7/L12 [Oscillospiraceae bacterium]
MASEKVTALIEEIKVLTVIELSELVHALEEEFGVSAAAMAAPAGGGGASAAEAAEEQTEFDVVMTSFGAEKVKVIKEVRAITSLGLAEAKALVEGVPAKIKEGVNKDEANEIKEKLTAAGATVEIK